MIAAAVRFVSVFLFLVMTAEYDQNEDQLISENQKALLEEIRELQREFNPKQNLTSKRIVVCKMAGGLGNRMQGVVSCVALGIALRRAIFVDWERESRTEPGPSNGLMPCSAAELFEESPSWNWDIESAIGMHSAQERRDATVEAYRSQLLMSSGQTLDWASLLLCRNLTYLLKRTPILAVPAWRWMPEVLQNAAFRPAFERLLRGRDGGVLPFYSSLVAALFRPIPAVRAAAGLTAYASCSDGPMVGGLSHSA